MFNFIFDGKLGDILAPVVPTNKLFLAIQHHKNNEVQNLIMTNDFKSLEIGYSAIHVACRYNNRYALELILSKDVKVETKDQKGNTPLHYASKYGHIDLCKYLIDQGSSTTVKNINQETPYDVADNHIVRQYLLPLQLSAERSNISGMDPITMSALGYATSTPVYNVNHNVSYPSTGILNSKSNDVLSSSDVSTTTPIPIMTNNPPPAMAPYATTTATIGTIPLPNTNPSQQQPGPIAQGGTYQIPRPAATSTTRIIQPDGFHSSASDPVLQKRYGHVYETKNIAPPPTAITYTNNSTTDTTSLSNGTTGITSSNANNVGGGYSGSYSMYSAPPPINNGPRGSGLSAPNPIYNRYVPYDVNHNSTAPSPHPISSSTTTSSPLIYSNQSATFPSTAYNTNNFQNNTLSTNTIIPIETTTKTPNSQNNKLLGNKSVVPVFDLLQNENTITPSVGIVPTNNIISNSSTMNKPQSRSNSITINSSSIGSSTNSNNINSNTITITTATSGNSSYYNESRVQNFDQLSENDVITASSSSSAVL